MERYKNIIVSLTLLTFVMSGTIWAKPVNKPGAEKAVRGWLKADTKPMNMPLGGQVKKVDTYNGEDGQPAYHIVYLEPSGFVIVSTDDVVEPIIGFVSGDTYDPSPQNCLKALIERDVPNRVANARKIEQEVSVGGKDKLSEKAMAVHDASVKAKDKWSKLQAYADGGLLPMLSSISDVRIPVLVQSKWNQGDVAGGHCYNYYTPNNYVCGCVATAFAQVVRYFQYQPAGGIGVHTFPITIDGSPATRSTRGGNGSGGPYNWTDMVLVPGSGITETQRQAIGALCYDCGVTVEMGYSAGGSGAWMHYVARSLKDIYGYTNAFITYHDWYSKDSDLLGMINPNLEAGLPVLFSVWDQGNSEHAIICDGYGYNSSTMYHHINMGWGGSDDAWYNIPDISYFSVVDSVTYNIYTSGTGEIISGRVTSSGTPINDATVTATGPGGPYTDATDAKGIYALAKVGSNSTYTIHVSKSGYTFDDQIVTTGTSANGSRPCGNKWGINFEPNNAPPPAPEISVDFEAGTPAGWSFYDLIGDIDRSNTVDLNDLNILVQNWLEAGCSDANQWCTGADIDASSDVTFVDYTLLANDWSKQVAKNVLVQTIYGTAQDVNGTITANTYRALSQNKGMAMAFAVDANTILDKAIFKCAAGTWDAGENIHIRLYDVTGKGYLTYNHSISKDDPGSGSIAIIDYTKTTPGSVPYHLELGDGKQYTNMVIDFNSCEVTAGQYLIVFDATGPGNTWASFIKGDATESPSMGKYPDDTPLPKCATVTTSSATGNAYYYELGSTSDTSYTPRSNLFAFQILIKDNRRPVVNAGSSQIIIDPNNTANLDGTVTDDGRPDPPGAVTTTWTKQSGPGPVTFGDANAIDTTVTFSSGVYGTYILCLTASDGELSAYDEVTIIYNDVMPTNQAPDVNAGPDQEIALPASATLDGTVTDDGLPIPPGAVITTWTTQSGPDMAVFGNASVVDTIASFPVAGTYVLRLTANDGALSGYDEVTIIVNPAPPPAPASISYPESSTSWEYTVSWSLVTGATSYQLERSDNGGSSWSQIYSGSSTSYAEFIGNGSYRYRIKATKSGASSDWRTGTWDCVVSIPPPPSWSEIADYYVDGPSGSDRNPGTSSQPFKTFAKAVSTATAGQKVLVWGGQTYSGYVSFTISGTSASPITFKRDPASSEAVLDGAAATKGVLDTTTAAYIVIDGFKLTNAKFGAHINGDNCDGWIIKNCRVTANTNNGLYLENGDNNLFFNNAVYLNSYSNNGIQISATALNNDIVQCTVYKQEFGVYISGSSTGGNIRDCIITGNKTYGVRLYASSSVTVSYTDCWGHGTNYSGNGFIYGAGNISADPLLVNPDGGDFHLSSGSPCIGTASDSNDMGYRYSSSAL